MRNRLQERDIFTSILAFVAVVAILLRSVLPSQAADAPLVPPPKVGPFTLLSPEHIDLSVFGGGYVSADYAMTEQGVQISQSITRNIGIVGRATGYQLYIHDSFDNPLNPGTGHQARLNFGRLQAGLDFHLSETTYASILGGGDVGDSNAATVEGDFATWFFSNSTHPLNLAASSIYNTQNKVLSSEVDSRVVAYATASCTVLVGGGGAIYAAGFVHGVLGQGGPIVGVYWPAWNLGFEVQSGYGSAKEYGQITLYKQFGWTE
jgi:hypothetical protein